jgi:hypothetical protein
LISSGLKDMCFLWWRELIKRRRSPQHVCRWIDTQPARSPQHACRWIGTQPVNQHVVRYSTNMWFNTQAESTSMWFDTQPTCGSILKQISRRKLCWPTIRFIWVAPGKAGGSFAGQPYGLSGSHLGKVRTSCPILFRSFS